MKKYIMSAVLMLLVFSVQVNCEASEIKPATIITVPLDSRPISIEYLENLSRLGEDTFIVSNKADLDFFTADYPAVNKFAQSRNVRADLANKVSSNDTESSTVIINTSSYITGGLIGSRCYKNYEGYETALNDLRHLTTAYQAPYYYVNATMPRTLPEDRNNTFWPNSTRLKGLGHFYLQVNKESKNNSAIKNQFALVTPAQLLMEWSYVQTKANEKGPEALSKWEKDFLNYFNQTILSDHTYAQYAYQYKMTYKHAADIIKQLMNMSQVGNIDELVVSVDDFQLPNFIVYMHKLPDIDKSWIQQENENPIKYSYARFYLQTDLNSVYNYHQSISGQEAFNKALSASGQGINYFYGVDEVPQAIYARDLVRRTNLSTRFTPINFDYNIHTVLSKRNIGTYDSITTEAILHNTINFVTRVYDQTITLTNRPFKMYVNQYLEGKVNIDKNNADNLIKDMFNTYNNGYNVGLIELYSFDVINNGSNELFRNLSDKAYLAALGLENNAITQLGSYSSWNTVGNAVGLGAAHAQVFGIMEQLTTNETETALKHSKILAQHLLEDGVYGGQLKSKIWNQKYDLSSSLSIVIEKTLLKELNDSNVLNSFLNTPVRVGNKRIQINNFDITRAGFPWLRTFDCYVEVELWALEQSSEEQ